MKRKLLVIGIGSIGKRHISNFKKYFKEIYILDNRPDRLKEACSLFNITGHFQSLNKALSFTNYDTCLICTPPSSHLGIALKCVQKGIPIFIEKPLGMSCKGWKQVSDICKRKKLVNYVAYCHRFINYTNDFLKILKNKKKIGKIYSINLNWCSYLPNWHPHEKYTNFYMAKKEQGGGALLDDSHGIDLIRYFFGEVKKVSARIYNLSELKLTSDDSFYGFFEMKNNAVVQIKFELFSRINDISITVHSSNGTFIWDRVNHQIVMKEKNKKIKIKRYKLNNLMNMYTDQTKFYFNLLKKNKKHFNTIEDALNTQKIIDKCFLSSKKRRIVNV